MGKYGVAEGSKLNKSMNSSLLKRIKFTAKMRITSKSKKQ